MNKGITLKQFTSGVKTIKTELDQKILACEQAVKSNSEADANTLLKINETNNALAELKESFNTEVESNSKLEEELATVKGTVEEIKASSGSINLIAREW